LKPEASRLLGARLQASKAIWIAQSGGCKRSSPASKKAQIKDINLARVPQQGARLQGLKSGILKNRQLARAISLQRWRIFRMLCEFKAAKYLQDFQVVNRWEPTSQVC